MTTHREIAEVLRNPDGAYFAENTPAMIALETMVDNVGVRNVLWALAGICSAKADHAATNWQDQDLAKDWEKHGAKLDNFARKFFDPLSA